MDLDSVADALYALPPDEFTAARDDEAKRADPQLKQAIKSLRKPTASAHIVNLLVRDRPDDVDGLLEVGERLRAAMTGDKGDVRRLAERRRDLVSALVPPDLPAGVRDEVTATLEAATADPELGRAVRSGRLVKPLRYAGFGAPHDPGDAAATAVPSRRPAAKAAPRKPPAANKPATPTPAKVDRDLTEMRRRVLELSGAADDAQRRYDEAARAAAEAHTLLDRAEAERAAAHKAARESHAAAERARRELGRLERS
jgi:hypothetical protein